jgi:hypothetical protein
MTNPRVEYETQFVCDVCNRLVFPRPTYDHDQIDGEEWYHLDDDSVICEVEVNEDGEGESGPLPVRLARRPSRKRVLR